MSQLPTAISIKIEDGDDAVVSSAVVVCCSFVLVCCFLFVVEKIVPT